MITATKLQMIILILKVLGGTSSPNTIHGYRTMKQNTSELKAKVKQRGQIIIDYHPSENKVYAARQNNTKHCQKSDYYLGKLCLEKNKEGKNKRKTNFLSVLIRKNLLDNITSVIELESDDLIFENDNEPLTIVINGDAGGGRDLDNFCLLNKADEVPIKLHPIAISDGSDSLQNKKIVLKELAKQIEQLDGEKIMVKGINREMVFKTVIDMKHTMFNFVILNG